MEAIKKELMKNFKILLIILSVTFMSCGSTVPIDKVAGYSLKSKKEKMQSVMFCKSKIIIVKP